MNSVSSNAVKRAVTPYGEQIEVASGVNCILFASIAGDTGCVCLYMFPVADLTISVGAQSIATLPQVYRPTSAREFTLSGRLVAGLDGTGGQPRLLISDNGDVSLLNYSTQAIVINTPTNILMYIK